MDSHGDILRKHFGEFATVRSTEDIVFCDIHGYDTPQNQDDYYVESTFIPDAQRLLEQAQNMINVLEPGTEAYNNLQGAMINLQNIISQPSPSAAAITEAMTNLTNHMAVIQ